MSNQEYLKIKSMHLTHLRDEEHFQFMTDMNNLFAEEFVSYSTETKSVDTIITAFTELYNREDIAIETINKSELTDPIAEADTTRDNSFRGLSLFVEAYTFSSDAAKAEAARRLKIVIDHYGDVRKKTYNEETASIYNLLQELKDNHISSIEDIDATDWISELKQNNVAFESLIQERFDNNAGKPKENIRQIRKDIDKAYKNIVSYIEVTHMISGDNTYTDLINKMNERITYYKNTLAQRKGRSDAKDDEEELW